MADMERTLEELTELEEQLEHERQRVAQRLRIVRACRELIEEGSTPEGKARKARRDVRELVLDALRRKGPILSSREVGEVCRITPERAAQALRELTEEGAVSMSSRTGYAYVPKSEREQ